MRHYIDDEMKLFAGAASSGHVPVLSTLDPSGHPKEKILQKQDICTVDWDGLKGKLETKAEDVLTPVETKNATYLWDMMKELLNDAQIEFK